MGQSNPATAAGEVRSAVTLCPVNAELNTSAVGWLTDRYNIDHQVLLTWSYNGRSK
jgi:hypothetical protein